MSIPVRPAADDASVLDVVLKLTAITLLLRPLDVWWVSGFVLLLAMWVIFALRILLAGVEPV